MSHFTVVVFTKSGTEDEVTRLLAPFQEREEWFEEGSRWDWWVVGGRWDGRMLDLPPLEDDRGFNFGDEFHTLERNACPTPKIADGFAPFAFVTPDGMWTEKGRMGWFAMVDGEKEQQAWDTQWREARTAFSDSTAVLVDCHI